MGTIRAKSVTVVAAVWMLGVAAVPAALAQTSDEECGPYTGVECDPEAGLEPDVLDDVQDEADVEDVEDVRVESVDEVSDERSALAITGADALVIAGVGLLVLGVGIVTLRSRRRAAPSGR
jgi:hypothetical protein